MIDQLSEQQEESYFLTLARNFDSLTSMQQEKISNFAESLYARRPEVPMDIKTLRGHRIRNIWEDLSELSEVFNDLDIKDMHENPQGTWEMAVYVSFQRVLGYVSLYLEVPERRSYCEELMGENLSMWPIFMAKIAMVKYGIFMLDPEAIIEINEESDDTCSAATQIDPFTKKAKHCNNGDLQESEESEDSSYVYSLVDAKRQYELYQKYGYDALKVAMDEDFKPRVYTWTDAVLNHGSRKMTFLHDEKSVILNKTFCHIKASLLKDIRIIEDILGVQTQEENDFHD